MGLIDAGPRHDLLELMEERHGRRSVIITSQQPMDKWRDIIGDPTYAAAILDRRFQIAHRIDLDGPSLRNPSARAVLTNEER